MSKVRNSVYAAGYSEAGASTTRRALKGFTPYSLSSDRDINDNNSTLRARSRMLYMSSPIATSAINTNRTKIVGTGLTFKSSIDRNLLHLSPDYAKDWENNVKTEFALWADSAQSCDALGINDFESLQQLTLVSWLLSGDVFVLIKRTEPTVMNPYSLRLHIVEADRVCTPDHFKKVAFSASTEGVVPKGEAGAGNLVHDGVEVDAEGKVIAYYVCNKHPGDASAQAKAKWTRVLAYGEESGLPNVLHIMNSERPDQYRGVPYLAQVIEPLLQLRRYTESELMAALVQSFFTAWIETEEAPSEFPLNEVGAGEVDGIPSENPEHGISADPNEYEMAPGTVTTLAKGEKITFGNPNIPTAGFDAFVSSMVKQIGAALELPYDVIIKEFNSSYSSSRGALLEAWEAFRMRRKWFVSKFCQPIYEIWLAEAVAIGRIKAIGFFSDPRIKKAYCGAQWIGPVQGQLDPKKEAVAAITEAVTGVKTFTQITRELGGGDFSANVEQLRYERELLKEAGISTISPTGAVMLLNGEESEET